jgi:hypothetical protein
MTRGEIAPGIDDRYDWLSLKVIERVTHLFRARAMPKRSHVIHAKPSMTT